MVPRNSSLRAHPADTSTGCAVCVLSSFQRTRSCRDPRPFDPAFPTRVGCLLPPRSSLGEPYNLTTGTLGLSTPWPLSSGLFLPLASQAQHEKSRCPTTGFGGWKRRGLARARVRFRLGRLTRLRATSEAFRASLFAPSGIARTTDITRTHRPCQSLPRTFLPYP